MTSTKHQLKNYVADWAYADDPVENIFNWSSLSWVPKTCLTLTRKSGISPRDDETADEHFKLRQSGRAPFSGIFKPYLAVACRASCVAPEPPQIVWLVLHHPKDKITYWRCNATGLGRDGLERVKEWIKFDSFQDCIAVSQNAHLWRQFYESETAYRFQMNRQWVVALASTETVDSFKKKVNPKNCKKIVEQQK